MAEHESPQALKSWWANFKKGGKKKPGMQSHRSGSMEQGGLKSAEPPAEVPRQVFGVPLQQSIKYANVAISLLDDRGQSFIYGYVPIVVAKCGVYLKEKGRSSTLRAHKDAEANVQFSDRCRRHLPPERRG
jgi:GTPase-activating protein SAC7